MRVIRTILSKFYLYFLWAFFSFLAVGFIFGRLGDTGAAHKVVLFADVPAMRDTELAYELEQSRPEGVRMVQVHPFSYALFDGKELFASDLYIIPESRVEQYADNLRPIDGAPFGAEGGYYREGELWGVLVWDAERREGAAADWIEYPEENCWLFVNRNSRHVRTLSGTGDDAAILVAQRFLALGARAADGIP